MQKGTFYGIIAYVLWGIFPIYWKWLRDVNALEILCHRIIWAFVFILCLQVIRKDWRWIKIIIQRPRRIALFVLTATILSVNWLTFIWAVNHGFIVEASLGYFINPLLNVLLGFIFLREHLRPGQLVAILLAVIGVGYLTFNYGMFPWIALTLACTFSLYGLLRKIGPLGSIEGLSMETAILLLPALLTILMMAQGGNVAFGQQGIIITVLLMLAGVVTATPLLFFAAAARRITFTALGLLLYISPSLQFILGVFVYHEPFNRARFIGFCFIWSALVFYTIEGYRNRRWMNLKSITQ